MYQSRLFIIFERKYNLSYHILRIIFLLFFRNQCKYCARIFFIHFEVIGKYFRTFNQGTKGFSIFTKTSFIKRMKGI